MSKHKNEYFIQLEKPQTEEVKRKYPNLAKSPRYINLARLRAEVNLADVPDKKLKKVLKKRLKGELDEYSRKEALDKKETIRLNSAIPKAERDFDNPIWKGDLKIPKKHREQDIVK